MKKFFLLIAATLTLSTANAQLLYKITGKGLKSPSYIVGTHHLTDASFADQINGLKEAMANTKQVYGEMNMDVTNNPDSMQLMLQATLLPEGQTLKTILKPEQYEKLSSFCIQLMGMGLDNEMLFSQIGRLTPATLNTQFSLLLYIKNHQTAFNLQNGIDNYFQSEAKKNGKKVGGLETLAFQTGVLLKKSSLERQIELLMCLVDNAELFQDLADRLTNAYLSQDMNAMYAINEEKLHNTCDSTPEELDILLYSRNADWAKKMPRIMAEAPTLFAVGSLHIPGEKGLVKLLKEAGYKVEAVK